MTIGAQGLTLGAWAYTLYGFHQEIEQARTVAFTVMVFAQLVHSLNCRSGRLSLFQLGIGTNRALVCAFLFSLVAQVAILTVPAIAQIFKVVLLPIEDWVLMGGLGVQLLLIMEAMLLCG